MFHSADVLWDKPVCLFLGDKTALFYVLNSVTAATKHVQKHLEEEREKKTQIIPLNKNIYTQLQAYF